MAEDIELTGPQPGDLVELADKDGGFYDSETALKIVRDQKVAIGEHVGEKTQMALSSGTLLIVSGKAKPDGSAKPAAAPKSKSKTAVDTEEK